MGQGTPNKPIFLVSFPIADVDFKTVEQHMGKSIPRNLRVSVEE